MLKNKMHTKQKVGNAKRKKDKAEKFFELACIFFFFFAGFVKFLHAVIALLVIAGFKCSV